MHATTDTAASAGHTPGPWCYFAGNANGRGLIRIEADMRSPEAGAHIASLTRGPVSEANARVLAAAPELLDALKACVAPIVVVYGSEAYAASMGPSWAAGAIAAIARAEGR